MWPDTIGNRARCFEGKGMYGRVAVVAALSLALTCAAAVTGAARVPLPPCNPSKNTEQEKKQNSKPAMDLFSQKKLPSLGNAMAIGYYPRGCLQGGVELPTTGPNWQVMRVSRNRNWGHPELVQFLERFAPLAAEATGWKGILIGVMAQPRGGPLPFGHRSHQIGLDVDIWFMPMPDRVLSTEEREKFRLPTWLQPMENTSMRSFGLLPTSHSSAQQRNSLRWSGS
jgi:murein endopeptidase